MLKNLFGLKKERPSDEVVTAVVTQTAALINDLHRQMELRFKEVSAQMHEIELSITQLETKLLTKDLKDKQAYGLLHYKLHESKNAKLEEEINDLENKLSHKKNSEKDH
ncbi:MAG: hypothetical protein AB7I27_05305 [Bacteriovoracaceae bacterium]